MHSISVGYSRQRATTNPSISRWLQLHPSSAQLPDSDYGNGCPSQCEVRNGCPSQGEVRRCCLVKKRLHAADPVQLVWNGPCGKIFENGAVYSLRYAVADWPESLWWLEDVGKMYLMGFKDAANNGFRCGIWNINHGGMVSLIELRFYCWW